MMPRAFRWVAAMCLLPAVAVAQSAAPSGDPPAAPSVASSAAASLQPGDAVRITVFEMPSLSGEISVAPDGTLQHPVYNRLTVVGVPTSALHARVEEFLRTLHREPQVSVEPLVRVTVGGEVRTPNSYLFPPNYTVADAVASAGGAASEGRLDRVRLDRGPASRTLDLTRPDTSPRENTIRSGDRITVERRRNTLRDVAGPTASIAATILTIVNLFTRR